MSSVQSDNDLVGGLVQSGITYSEERLQLLDDPSPRDIWCPIISADDHVLEPGDIFAKRVPSAMRDRVPTMVELRGRPHWIIEGQPEPIIGANAAKGRPENEYNQIALGFDEMRPGVKDPAERVKDMDLNGVWASLCFPSINWGFAGRRFAQMADQEAGLACVRAYNDWVVDEWAGAAPDRFIPFQLPWLKDPAVSAQEIYRNAARGVHAVSFSENPSALGFTSIYSRDWDPFWAACEETQTVLNLHCGSSGIIRKPSPETPIPVSSALFPISGIEAVCDWIFAKIPVLFPDIKIVTSEAGAAWVPMVHDRLHHLQKRRESFGTWWTQGDPPLHELLRRNFWYTSIEDPSAFRNLDVIGADRVMLETDYPHSDSTWPNTQVLIRKELEHLPPEIVRAVCYGTAAKLYHHSVPSGDLLDRSTYQFAASDGGR